MGTRILLADDHTMVRQGLRLLLLLQGKGFEVGGGEAANGKEAAHLAEQSCPDVAVLDYGMPLLNGMDAARKIMRICPRTRVILLTMTPMTGRCWRRFGWAGPLRTVASRYKKHRWCQRPTGPQGRRRRPTVPLPRDSWRRAGGRALGTPGRVRSPDGRRGVPTLACLPAGMVPFELRQDG